MFFNRNIVSLNPKIIRLNPKFFLRYVRMNEKKLPYCYLFIVVVDTQFISWCSWSNHIGQKGLTKSEYQSWIIKHTRVSVGHHIDFFKGRETFPYNNDMMVQERMKKMNAVTSIEFLGGILNGLYQRRLRRLDYLTENEQ